MRTLGPAPRLHARVVDALVERIVGGELAAGSVLPSEPEMSAAFGVSRAVIREALRVLGSKGLIDVRHGSGAYVTADDRWDPIDAAVLAMRRERGLMLGVLRDLLDARRIVEPEVAALAAGRRSPADAAALTSAIAVMRDAVDVPERFVEADSKFHRALLAATGNRVLDRMMSPLHELVHYGQEVTDSIPGVLHRALCEHEAIADAVIRQDAPAAREAMRRHLDATDRDITSLNEG